MNEGELITRCVFAFVIATVVWAAFDLLRRDCSFGSKCIWLLIIASVPFLGPILYYIRFRT
jgi:hypothetical protein